jgi:hypothetical protein
LFGKIGERNNAMIIVKVFGGLGNQMFQYAFARRLAYERGVKLKVDLSWFQTQTMRIYMLDRFNIATEIATPEEIIRLTKSNWTSISGRIHRAVQWRLPYYHRLVVEEAYYAFDPEVFKVGRNALIVGYWQSEKFFLPIHQTIRKEFKLKQSLSQESLNWANKIQSCNSISIHVRRGDFIGDTSTNQSLPISYYQHAVEYLLKHCPDPNFFIFSDDLPWAYHNLNIHISSKYVHFEEKKGDEEELILISLCKNHIIANSTFSWWGAWLCANPGKIVIAPKNWINDTKINNNDLLPDSWIRI